MKKKTRNTIFILFLTLIISYIFLNDIAFAKDAVKAATKVSAIDLLGTDTKNPQKVVVRYIYMFGGVTIAFGLTLVGFKMILSSHNSNMREDVIKSFGKVIIGSLIIGSSLLFAGFLINLTNNMGISIDNNLSDITSSFSNNIEEKEGSFLIKGLAEVISGFAETVFSWFGSLAGFLPLNELIFNDKTPFGITGTYAIPPFTEAEWHNLNYIYMAVCSICAPFVLIMVAKTGFALIFSTTSALKRSQLSEDILRWFFTAVIIATAPILVKGLFLFCNYMTDSLATVFNASIPKDSFAFSYNLMSKIKTGNVLSTAVIKFLYAWKYVEINLIFLSRKVILVVMYAFTPIATLLWGINNKVQASQIWFGEMITNASMQFFYAFTFSVMILSLGTATWQNWLYSLIWMFALIKVTDVLRNSLQGFFTRMSGVDESQIGSKAVGSIGGMIAGASAAFGQSVQGNSNSGLNMNNIKNKAFGDSLSSFGKNNGSNGVNKFNSSQESNGVNDNFASMDPTSTNINPNTNQENITSDGSSCSNFDMNEENPSKTSDFTTDSNNGNTINVDDFQGMDTVGDVVDKNGNVNVDNLKNKSNRQLMYNALLNDNIKKYKNNSKFNNSGSIVSTIANASTGFDSNFSGFAKGIENIVSGVNNRHVLGKAINDTVNQIQEMSGISAYEINDKGKKVPIYNVNKETALKDLFGGNSNLKNKFKQMSFKTAVSTGNTQKAEQILSDANTVNADLNQKQRNVIIAKTNPYTSADGFRW